ncbi:MAG TPA: S41 family peptidase [Patescibacteria group bacterium]|nr:S41 family peptidase [Patescibacteria group bacterium]
MSQKNKKIFSALVAAVALFAIGYALGQQNFRAALQGGRVSFTNQAPPKEEKVDFKLFWDVYSSIQKSYYDKTKIDGEKILYGAIQGMVGSLGDPYTSFLNPEQNKAVKGELAGTYEGVGIQLGYKDSQLVVISPLEGTPAKAAGVKAGDLILKIGDRPTEGISLPDAVTLIRGAAGTEIEMTFRREGSAEPYVLKLIRAKIQVRSVEFTDKGSGVGYIKLSRFADNTNAEWTAVVDQAIQAGSRVIILDVRDNPGGYLNSSVFISSEFVSSGTIVKQESGGQIKSFDVARAGKLLNIPVVVLLNKGSASASEIVAGALQDYGRAVLVGEQSFGKGTIQEVEDVSCQEPSCPSLHLTTAKWLTPKGRWVNETGLTPDIKVGLSEEDFKAGRDPQLIRAVEVAKGKI